MSDLVPSDVVLAIQNSVKTETIVLEGRDFTTRKVFEVPAPPLISTLKIHTLTGLVDYITVNPDGLNIDTAFLHVVNPTYVKLLTRCIEPSMQRPNPATADCDLLLGDTYNFGQYRSIEQTIVDLQAKFVLNVDLESTLAIIGNLKEEAVNSYSDDGVTQTVQTRQGISRVANTDIPSRLRLQPYRTFPEIEQPVGEFILRLRKSSDKDGGIVCALFESGYSTWQASAIGDISTYLTDELERRKVTTVSVIA
jgi:hypothetical protein